MAAIKILLVGEELSRHSLLARRLADWGADLQFASSCRQACALLKPVTFDLVVSRLRLPDGSALKMAPLLEGTSCSLFCSHLVAVGAWWLPVVEQGKLCWGAPALRSNEFTALLQRTIEAALHTDPLRIQYKAIRVTPRRPAG